MNIVYNFWRWLLNWKIVWTARTSDSYGVKMFLVNTLFGVIWKMTQYLAMRRKIIAFTGLRQAYHGTPRRRVCQQAVDATWRACRNIWLRSRMKNEVHPTTIWHYAREINWQSDLRNSATTISIRHNTGPKSKTISLEPTNIKSVRFAKILAHCIHVKFIHPRRIS